MTTIAIEAFFAVDAIPSSIFNSTKSFNDNIIAKLTFTANHLWQITAQVNKPKLLILSNCRTCYWHNESLRKGNENLVTLFKVR
jgi:hypothetical protein